MKLSSIAAAASAAVLCVLTRPVVALGATAHTGRSEKTPLDLSKVDTTHAGTSGGGGGLVRTFVGLAVVIGVIYGLYWILKQVKSGREERASGHGLTTIATLPLGPNRALHMVRAGREVVLLGVAEQRITPVRSYSEDEARSLGLLDPPDDDDTPGPATRPARPTASVTATGGLLESLRQRTVRR
jgi:flagellar protein FliO/FliZ